MAAWRGSGLGRDYRRLWVANAVSVTGDGVTVTAGPLLAASITHDPVLVAGALFAHMMNVMLGSTLAILVLYVRVRLGLGTQGCGVLLA